MLGAGVACIYNRVIVHNIAVLRVVDDSLRKDQIVVLVIPVQHHSIGVVGMDISVRSLYFGNCVSTQRQGNGNFAFRAIVGHF